jgi:hypothetical protein
VSSPKNPSVNLSLVPRVASPRTSTSLEASVVIRQVRKTSTAMLTDMHLSSMETFRVKEKELEKEEIQVFQ